MRSWNISLDLKTRIYETLVIQVFLRLRVLEIAEKRRKTNFSAGNVLIKKILGVSELQKIRNEEIRSSLNQKETLCKNTVTKINLFDYVDRMEDNRILHRVLHCYITGNRSRGRQRKTRMDNVKDLQTHNSTVACNTKIISKLFHRVIGAHEYFSTCSMSLK